MLNNKTFRYLNRFAIVLAIAYIIPVIFFLKDRRFSDTWLLYVGSGLFLVISFLFGILYGHGNADGSPIPYNGFTVAILGVIFSVILIILFTLLLAPDIFGIGVHHAFRQMPPEMTPNWPGRILFILIFDAVVMNFAAGTFSALMTKGLNATE
jgi:hypothetical protein